MKTKVFALIISLLVISAGNAYAQDFGFGFDSEDTASARGSLNVTVNGEVTASMIGFIDDMKRGAESVELGDIFTGRLGFSASASNAEGVINLNLNTTSSPFNIDEAYARAFLGSFDITAGLKKLTWGKADSMGPLDVINPLDTSRIYTTLADQTSLMSVKIARPLVHASYRFAQFSKIEGVFVPWFEPHYIAAEGRWMPSQLSLLSSIPDEVIIPPIPYPVPLTVTPPEPLKTTTVHYAQAGFRFTTTIGGADIGLQYYYGRLPQPAVSFTTEIDYGNPPSLMPSNIKVDIFYKYNPYHQVGIDYAQVLFGFNIRAEVAANITEDLEGNDGSVYNPSIAWSLGFDRDLFWGINLNMQATETIRLMHDKLGEDFRSISDKLADNPMGFTTAKFDIEGGMPLTSTRLTAALSKKFLRDELEIRAAVVWGIEDKDCAVMPAVIWTKNDLRFAISGGFFAGESLGQLGQYGDNNFIKISLAYLF